MTRATIAGLVGALIFAASASAGSPNVAWTGRDIKSAIRVLGYPKPHPKKLGCKGSGAQTDGKFASFRCVATYKHHRRNAFLIEGQGFGGWLCAGKTLTACKVLRHGFASSGQVAFYGSLAGEAEFAARGYVQNRYQTFDTFPAGPCTQAGTRSWSCSYKLDTGTIAVTITLKQAKGGYTVAAAAVVS